MSYKEKARAYFSAVNNYDVGQIESMLDKNYIQHNPFVPTGRAAFVELIPKLKSFGSKITNVRMLEDSRHVIMHHKWENATPFGADHVVAFHIIRFDANDLIAEHWSLMMEDLLRRSSEVSLSDGSTKIEDLDKTNENKNAIKELLLQDGSDRKIHKIFGEGNFCLAISEGTQQGVPSAIYDLFRLKEAKVVEHWRIAQPIPTENLANANTMFGFQD